MHSYLFLLLLPLAQALPVPQFAGIGPWEGDFFGRDPGQEYRHGLTPYPAPMMAPGPNPYGQQNPYAYGDQNPYAYGEHNPYGHEEYPTYPGGAPMGFIAEPEAPPPPPPPEPIDLMSAPREKLPKKPQPKTTAPPKAEPTGLDKAKAETAEKPEKDEKKAEGDSFDFMGGKWGIAGQGKYIDDARGEHKMPAGTERGSRRGKYGRFGDDQAEKHGEETSEERKKKEEEAKEEEEKQKKEEEKPDMPPVEVVQDPDHPLRYNVNVGGIKTGPNDDTGPSNFHVFTDEGKREFSSNDMNPETEKYIFEKMVPKLSGKRKKGGNGGGNIFSVFGDGN